ncbi:39S ribosomal protein L1, mitochondrial [Apodemus sylvaticus]|uniref:39S ribosomal protein L1, mitochondrial n=1 Tax=Apodemus sylvaticus TaxID=10129 RepID=UPI002241C351|nr:39S ribosomal protein L1, mitochondrial [Apodemus sylvaticus]
MAAAVRYLRRVLIHHQRHSLCKSAYQTSLYPCSVNSLLLNRHFAAAAAAATKPARKIKKGAKEKPSDEKPVDDIEKIKSYTYMESDPEDDVYLKRLYPRRIYEVEKAIHLLKKFQVLDFTNPKQGVYLDLTLDMALGKKKKVEPFASVIALPHPFSSEVNKVAVFTGNASEIKIAEENGAAFAGGTDLVKKILDDEVVVDFYVAVPEIMGELNPLRKKLKKKFPKATRNSIGRDIPKMLELFKAAHEIMVDQERQNFLSTKIATLDMLSDQIAANLQAVMNEVCRHRPLDLGPFVVRAFLRSSTSEGLLLKTDSLLPKEAKPTEAETEEAETTEAA